MVEYRLNRKGVVLTKDEMLGSVERSSDLQKMAEHDLAENLSRQYSKQSENNQLHKYDLDVEQAQLEKQVMSDTEDRANSKNMLFGEDETEDLFAEYHAIKKETYHKKAEDIDENYVT